MISDDYFPVMVQISGGETRTCLSIKDILEAVCETGGEELASLIQDLFSSIEEDNASLQNEINDYRRDFETEQEERTRLLSDLREDAEQIQILLESSRLNRKKIMEHLDEIMHLIDSET